MLMLYNSKSLTAAVSSFCYNGLERTSKAFNLGASCFYNHVSWKPVNEKLLDSGSFLQSVI